MQACNPSYTGGRGREISSLSPAQAKIIATLLKINQKAVGMVQVVECWPSRHKAMSLPPVLQ
jgi:hypothetical protein